MNGSFNSNTSGMYTWSGNGGTSATWLSSSAISTGGAVQVFSEIGSMAAFNLNTSIGTENFYELTLSISTNKAANFKAYLRMAFTPYSKLSNDEIFSIQQGEIKKIKLYFRSTGSNDQAIIGLEDSLHSGNLTYVIDNVELKQILNPWTDHKKINIVENTDPIEQPFIYPIPSPVIRVKCETGGVWETSTVIPSFGSAVFFQ